MQQGEEFLPLLCAPTCRAIFDNKDLYINHAHLSIASYLIIQNDRFLLDPNKQVNLSSCNLSQMDVMSIQPLVHSLYLWYYPPHVKNIYSDFEPVAHGYADCLDAFTPTQELKCMLDKHENQRANKGTYLFGFILVTAHNASPDGHRPRRQSLLQHNSLAH